MLINENDKKPLESPPKQEPTRPTHEPKVITEEKKPGGERK